jgi:hypothetical protein
VEACTKELDIDFSVKVGKGCTPYPWITRGGYFGDNDIGSMTTVNKALLVVAVPI